LAVREILKYPEVESVKVVDLDPAMTNLSLEHPKIVSLNQNSLADTKVSIVNRDAYAFLHDDSNLYDVIVIDLPDPKTVGLTRLYSRQFYATAVKHLCRGGVLVTQATSPSFSKDSFLSILKTMRAAGLPTIAFRNHIPTMGEWGWVLGKNSPGLSSDSLREQALGLTFGHVETRFLNQEGMTYMLSFGKGLMEKLDTIKVNDEFDLALYFYYQDGSWDLY
jgi:spermidine synthase